MLSLARTKSFVDYRELSAKTTGTITNIATMNLCWRILAEHGCLLFDESADVTGILSSGEASVESQNLTTSLEIERLRFARSIQMTLLEVISWKLKATIMIQGIFNLIAQHDQNTSIRIARDSKMIAVESKRDSTSMKTIAVVTMTLLPDAFAAVVIPSSILFSIDMGAFIKLVTGHLLNTHVSMGREQPYRHCQPTVLDLLVHHCASHFSYICSLVCLH